MSRLTSFSEPMIVVSFLVLVIISLSAIQVGAYQDDALYVNLAQALAENRGYVDMMSVGEPPHTFVPPVYPLMLAPLLKVFPSTWLEATNFWPLQFTSALLVLGGLGCFAVVLRQRKVAEWLSLLALTSLAPVTLGMARHIMTEAPYFLFSVAALALLLLWENRSRSFAWLMGALLFAILASTTRLIGISLLGAIAIYLLPRLSLLRWITASVALFAPITIWFARNVLLGTAAVGDYATGLTPTSPETFTSALAVNLWSILTAVLPNVLLPGQSGPQTMALATQWGVGLAPMYIGAVISGVVIIGFTHTVHSHAAVWAIELYLVLYIGVLVATQFALEGGERYLAPIFPFLVLYFWQGAKWMFQRIPSSHHPGFASRMMTVSMVLLLSLFIARGVQAVVQPVRSRLPDVTLGTTWLRENAPDDAIVMADGPREVYLYSKRKVIPFPPVAQSKDDYARQIMCTQADFVLIRLMMAPGDPRWDFATQQSIVPAIEQYPTIFHRVYSTQDDMTRVYQIFRPHTLTCH